MRNFASTLVKFSKLSHIQTMIWRPPKMAPPPPPPALRGQRGPLLRHWTVQKCYTFLSSSPKRWELLKNEIGVSLHNLSETRSTARLDVSNRSLLTSGGITNVMGRLTKNNFPTMTAACVADMRGVKKYLGDELYMCSDVFNMD